MVCTGVAAELATEHGVTTCGLGVDVTSRDSVQRSTAATEAGLGGPCDVIVANAGILVIKPALDISDEEWRRVLEVNLTGAFTTAAVFAARLTEAGMPGSIIFSSSLFGVRGGAGNAAYSASKFGLIGLAQSMAAELAPQQIRVNAVCPGQIGSVMLEGLFAERSQANGTSVDDERSRFTQRIPAGRLGRTDEVADTYVYLASDLSAYVTGQHVIVDGGWSVA